MRPYVLAENNWKELKDAKFELAVLPWGATEAHNYHLPYATDNIIADNIAYESARIAWENKAKIIVLPTIPFGVNTGQADILLDLNIYPSTQMAILSDLIEVLHRQGIHKLVVMNSHGGNDFSAILRELGAKYPDMFLCTCNWFRWGKTERFFDEPGDHADEVETSLMLHLSPQLVLPLSEAGDGHERKFKIKALTEGWVRAERRWSQVTADTGVGNPKAATKEKGETFFKAITAEIGQVLTEIAQSDINDMYA